MVKLIATDLDGTLLRENKDLPRGIFALIEELDALGILFAPASGRQYANLKTLFEPVAEKVVFVCENGALVKYRGRTLYLDPIEEKALKPALDEIRALPHLFPMLCGEKCAFIESSAQPFYDYAVQSYTNCKKVDCLDSVIGKEDICKIAVYDELSAAENCIKVLPRRLPKLRTILSGADWCDVSAPTADKGAAIRFLRGCFGLRREECVAFGDQMNDYEMLLECGKAFVTENAYPPLKKLIPHTVPSNEEEGVICKIRELIREEKGERI